MDAFMMSSRVVGKGGEPGDELAASMQYYVADGNSALDDFASWRPIDFTDFRSRVRSITGTFPVVAEEDNERQHHIALYAHGYNTDWRQAARRYAQLQQEIFSGSALTRPAMGVLVLYTWPSNGSAFGYLPDREDARNAAPLLANALVALHDDVARAQRLATTQPSAACRAKVSVIAHSMGAYVVQKALAITARRLNSPQLMSLVHQLVLVAADVDNDLFQRDARGDADGDLVANLCYRIVSLNNRRDQVLGASAGLKHFGTRRLGRSGLADPSAVWDNVAEVDVTELVDPKIPAHSAVFDSERTLELLRLILRGVDRRLLKV